MQLHEPPGRGGQDRGSQAEDRRICRPANREADKCDQQSKEGGVKEPRAVDVVDAGEIQSGQKERKQRRMERKRNELPAWSGIAQASSIYQVPRRNKVGCRVAVSPRAGGCPIEDRGTGQPCYSSHRPASDLPTRSKRSLGRLTGEGRAARRHGHFPDSDGRLRNTATPSSTGPVDHPWAAARTWTSSIRSRASYHATSTMRNPTPRSSNNCAEAALGKEARGSRTVLCCRVLKDPYSPPTSGLWW